MNDSSMGHGRYIAEAPTPQSIVLDREGLKSIAFVLLPGDGPVGMDIHLDTPGAEIDIAAICLAAPGDDVRMDINVHHNAPHCTSNQEIRALSAGKFRFAGRVVVAPGADGTVAHQQCHGILLAEDAISEEKPQLEIYADDVECSHGATVGHPDEDALFYMRSRGIPLAEARRLQLLSFLSPVLDKLSPEDRKKALAAVESLSKTTTINNI